MTRVDSSAIDAIGYDDAAHTLTIRFSSGEVYAYYGVPPAVFDTMRSAPSKGQFFSDHVRDRYDYRHLSG
jgi:hypothetical protein